MENFPNLPPPAAGGDGRPAFQRKAGLRTIPGSPEGPQAAASASSDAAPGAAPAAYPGRESQPAQMPLLHSVGDGARDTGFVSDEQFMQEFMKEDLSTPLGALALGIAGSLVVFGAMGAMTEVEEGVRAGLAGAIGTCMVAGILLVIMTVISIAAGWVVCKLFGEDYGTAGALFLRFSAVAAVQVALYGMCLALVGPFGAFFISIPFMFGVVMWLAGFDFMKALVFNAVSNLLFWIMVGFFMMSAAAAAAA